MSTEFSEMDEAKQKTEVESSANEPAQDAGGNAEEVEKQERDEFNAYVAELQGRIDERTVCRNQNLSCTHPPDEFFFKLDSSLKKNTAFVKKLKQFTALQLDSLMKDMSTLNLTKYVSEVSAAIVEAKLKMTDVPAVIVLCSKLHQIYGDFSTHFFENWQKVLTMKPGEKIQNPSKTRVDLRLYAELLSCGIFNNKSGFQLLGNILTGLISQDKEDHSNLSIILSFCRHCGEEYAGLVPKKMRALSKKFNQPLPTSTLLTPEKQQNLKNLLRDYFTTLCKHIKSEHKELQSAERSNKKIMESKGELSNDRREKLDLMQSNFEKLLSSAQTMSDLLNEDMPDLPIDVEASGGGIVMDMMDDVLDSQLDPWGDDETKSFYVDLPDLREFLPNYAPKNVTPPPEEEVTQLTEEALDMEIETEQLEVEEPALVEGDGTERTSASPEPSATEAADEPVSTSSSNSTVTPAPTISGQTTKQYFENFLTNLPNCLTRELIDSAAIDFLLALNTKNNRKKLARTIFGVQRTRLDLLPFYSRLVAIVNLVSRDISVDLMSLLKNEFRYLVKKKDQINIESKIKVIRFIGEMTKFGLYPKIEALFCLKLLLQDFQHHHIEMVCAFIEVCGQYLYNCRESRLRMNVYLEQMIRLKTAKSLDSRHVAQIENSYYLVKPPEGMGLEKKVRPVMHMYIRHLVFEELNKSNVDKMIKLMRRLNWDDPVIREYSIKCLSKAYNIRYHTIRCLADLVAGLSSYQYKAMMRVIDTVFEDIRAGLEIHSPRLAQRRVAMAKYLGELYNYRIVESSNVLNTLYSIISLGVVLDHNVVSDVDPPGSLFRLKLSCVLLETCGQYFTSATSKKRLDYFLIFFQQYYWFKKNDPFYTDDPKNLFPILIDHMYKECLSSVRPKLKLCANLEDAQEAVAKLKAQLYPELLASGGESTSSDGPQQGKVEGGVATLDSITEVDSENMTEDTSEAVPDDAESEDGQERGGYDEERLDDDNDGEIEMDVDVPEPLYEKPKRHEPSAEDLEFERAFERMTADSYQERMRETVKPSTKDIPVPMMAKSGKKSYDQLSQGTETPTADSGVQFVLMLRGSKNNKQQFKTFNAASDSQLAVNLKLQEQKIKEENEKVKRLTLNITERLEEEDYQESLLQAQRSPAQNKQRVNKPHKYKHQKGAPDADLIFQ